MAFNIITKNNYQDLSSYLGEQIIDKMKSNTKSLICLASGDTPLGAFKYIVDKFENKDLTNDNFVFVGLDEWVGMDKNDKGSCQEYMDEYLFNKLKISKNQIVQFDAKSDDLKNFISFGAFQEPDTIILYDDTVKMTVEYIQKKNKNLP